MSIVVDGSAAQWVFSTPGSANTNMTEAGWYHNENGPGIWTRNPNATVSLVFQGTSVYLYSTLLPQGGRMNITCDWKSHVVSLHAPEEQPWVAWNETGLNPTEQHAVKIQMVDGESINIDHVGIEPGEFSAFPPLMPSPIPPAFPQRSVSVTPTTSASIVTVTATMTMTPSPESSSDISLSKGAVVGIAVGLVAASLFAAFLFMWCWRRREKRDGYTESGARYSGIRNLSLPRWVRRRDTSDPRSTGPRFVQIEDRDKSEEEKTATGVSNRLSAFLPSIGRQSTLSMGPSAIFSVSTPPLSMLARNPQSSSMSQRNRSMAVTLSINTDVDSVRRGGNAGIDAVSKAGPSSRSQVIRSVEPHRRTSVGFSVSDRTSEWETILIDENEHNMDDADFYTEHFSSRSEHIHSEERTSVRTGDYPDDPDDISPDTPLLTHSPAMASSHVSLSHQSSATSHASRFSKGNKILRSVHSRRSSLRRSLGRLSQRSLRTPNTRTPVSKNSTSTTSTETPTSERHGGRYSTFSAFNAPILAETSELSESPPPVPKLANGAQTSPPLFPPSAWTWTSSSQSRSPAKLLRVHKPAGPRARSSSISSVASKSSSSGSVHSRTSSKNEQQDMLSVVEEASRSASVRSSGDRRREEDMDLVRV